VAVGKQAPLAVVAVLLAAYPDGAQDCDSNGYLALHIAVGYRAPAEVVRALLLAFPAGVSTRNGDNDLALHYALVRRASDEVGLYCTGRIHSTHSA
jgi:ankyrin repeat protein